MSRVLVTGGAGTIGAAVVRRLAAEPGFEVRGQKRHVEQFVDRAFRIDVARFRKSVVPFGDVVGAAADPGEGHRFRELVVGEIVQGGAQFLLDLVELVLQHGERAAAAILVALVLIGYLATTIRGRTIEWRLHAR